MVDVAASVRIAAIKRALKVSQVLTALGIPTDPGEAQILCPNPAHHERNPSARIYAEDHVHCFRCGESWDVVDLTMKIKRLALPDAIGWLEQRFGLANPVEHLTLSLPALLEQTVPPNYSQRVAALDARIREQKLALGPEKSLRLWMVLDQAWAGYNAHSLDSDALVSFLDRIEGAL